MNGYAAAIYSLADSEKIGSVLNRLSFDGFITRPYTDETENENSAKKEKIITDCEMCVVFISESSVNSHIIRNGLTQAVFAGKPILSFFIERTALSVGMEMQLSVTKKINSYEMTEDACYTELSSDKNLRKCHTGKAPVCWLERSSTGEHISLNKGMTNFGRLESLCDYVIRDNGYIGRLHASIMNKQGVCSLIDQGSKNKTYINGKAVEPKDSVRLADGDTINFANEKFVFHISTL